MSMGEEVKRFYLAKVAKLPEEEIVLYEHEMFQQKQPGYLVVLRKQTFGSQEGDLYWRGDFPTL